MGSNKAVEPRSVDAVHGPGRQIDAVKEEEGHVMPIDIEWLRSAINPRNVQGPISETNQCGFLFYQMIGPLEDMPTTKVNVRCQG
jgi:hypothetical protein